MVRLILVLLLAGAFTAAPVSESSVFIVKDRVTSPAVKLQATPLTRP